jgi:hypothetical protein
MEGRGGKEKDKNAKNQIIRVLEDIRCHITAAFTK